MEKPFKLHLFYTSFAIVLLIVISFLSLISGNKLPKTSFTNIDLVVHVCMYFVLSLAFYKGFFNSKWNHAATFACSLAFIYGIGIEFAQELGTNGRHFDVYDIISNGFGCLLAYFVISKYL